ncbi:MAG: sigma-54-dependent Fis family transcriptional regulator [candidate division Zixibacteria bacterium]|nr:sigma-54-dependent Fis family transcriptional regulator [candidate division Zixibacteria bacterium]
MIAPRQILVVDDDPLVNEFFEAALTRLGHTVKTSSSAEAALELMTETEFDLILSDVKMPNVTGTELLRQIKQECADTVVVMVTAYGTVKNAVEAMKLGAFDYILKPIMPDELEVAVNRALEHRELVLENRILKSEIKSKYDFGRIVGSDKKLIDLLTMLDSAAKSRATILITGESGTGKELIARAIHYNSPRCDGPFIKLNCAALPEGLIESELFGHEKGAFTNAIKQSRGRFEMADGGSLLLDEISEIPPGVQAKLLRVIQEREFERVGSAVSLKVDVRLVVTTNQNLEERIKQGKFREDLYYRLNVIPLHLPPLRERKGDIPMLAEYFLRDYNAENNRNIKGITEKAMKLLNRYHWPGNIRELENYIERAVVLCRSDRITEADLPSYLVLGPLAQQSPRTFDGDMTIAELEKVAIINTLEKFDGNRTRAAAVLGISSRTLRNKLHEYGLMGSGGSTEDLVEVGTGEATEK